MSLPQDRAEANPDTAYEATDWRVAAVAIVLAMVLVVVAIAAVSLRLSFGTAASDVSRAKPAPLPEPALQSDPAQDLARLRAREERQLNGYYWVDRESGVVHVPIDEAMKQVLARGLDGFPQARP